MVTTDKCPPRHYLFCNLYRTPSKWKVEVNKARLGFKAWPAGDAGHNRKKRHGGRLGAECGNNPGRMNDRCFCLKGTVEFLCMSLLKFTPSTGNVRKSTNMNRVGNVGNATTLPSVQHFLPLLKTLCVRFLKILAAVLK